MEDMTKNENVTKNEKERCVVCKAETDYMVGDPIEERQYYIEGVGQLCQKCHYDLYEKKER